MQASVSCTRSNTLIIKSIERKKKTKWKLSQDMVGIYKRTLETINHVHDVFPDLEREVHTDFHGEI